MRDNPSAFPHDLLRDDDAYPTHDASPGMTLRDYFAGQALAGLCADCNAYLPPREMARASYDLADALLAARGPQ